MTGRVIGAWKSDTRSLPFEVLYLSPIVLLNTRGFYTRSLADRVEDVLPTIDARPKRPEDAREYAVVRQAAG